MATAAVKKQRETLGAVNAFLNQKDPVLFVFRNIGDRARAMLSARRWSIPRSLAREE